MAKQINTFQDLLEALDELGYSAGTVRNIRPEVKRAAKIYNQPLHQIPADLTKFEQRWGRGRIAAIPAGFKDHKQFVNFRERIASVLGRIARGGAKRQSVLTPNWKQIVDFVKANGGVGRRLPPHLDKSIGAVGRECSRAGIEPFAITDALVAKLADTLKGANRRSFKLGIERLSDLIDMSDRLPEISHLLPSAALSPVPPKQLPSSAFRRNAGAPQAKHLWQDFDAFVQTKRGTDSLGRPIPAKASNFSEKTETAYANAIGQALTVLTRFGEITPHEELRLRDLCNVETIKRVSKHWNTRQINGEVKTTGGGLHTLVSRLSHIAAVMGAKKKERKALKKHLKTVKEAGKTIGEMMPERVAFVQSFAANPALQRAVFAMPETLMREANKVFAHWKEHKRKRHQKVMMDALKMGTTAAMSAILYRSAPIRASNLRSLRFRGDDKHIVGAEDGAFRLVFPAAEVKNNKHINQFADDDAWPIIDWYLREVRPKLLNDHPYSAKLVDSDYLFPSTMPHAALEDTTLANHYRRGCELCGVDLTFHLARHITVFVILNENPNAWAEAAAVLDDEISTVKKHYAWLDTERASKKGRELLQEARRNANRHKKGYQHAA